jgi:hypothetical protein
MRISKELKNAVLFFFLYIIVPAWSDQEKKSRSDYSSNEELDANDAVTQSILNETQADTESIDHENNESAIEESEQTTTVDYEKSRRLAINDVVFIDNSFEEKSLLELGKEERIRARYKDSISFECDLAKLDGNYANIKYDWSLNGNRLGIDDYSYMYESSSNDVDNINVSCHFYIDEKLHTLQFPTIYLGNVFILFS